MALSDVDLRALRQADVIVFEGGRNTHTITVIIDADHPRNTTGAQQQHHIQVNGRFRTFGPPITDAVRARAQMFLTGNLNAQTWVGLLREGDDLMPLWWADNGNSFTREAGLVSDELWLLVRRAGRDRYSFMIANDVCTPDAPGRMIRPRAEER